MNDCNCILIVVGNNLESAHKTADYVAPWIKNRSDVTVHLLAVLPPTPPEFLEYGGIDDMEQQLKADVAGTGDHRKWEDQEVKVAEHALEEVRTGLEQAEVSADLIRTHIATSIHEQHLAEHALELVRELSCQTIVISRESHPWYTRLFHREPSGELLRKSHDLTIWVIE